MERTRRLETVGIFTLCFVIFLLGIGSIGCSQTKESKKLIEDLNSLNLNTKEKAIEKLGDIKAKRAVDPLIAILNDKDEDIGVKEKSAIALGKIKSKKAIDPLITVLKNEDVDLQWRDAEEFRKDPIASGNAVAHFTLDNPHNLVGGYTIDTSKDKYGNYRYVYAFKAEDGKIVGTTNITVPDPHGISKVTFDFSDPSKNYVVERQRSVRKASAWALNEMKDDKRVEEAFITALKDKNLKVVAGAYKFFLEKIPEAQDILVEALKEYGDKQMAEDFLKSGNSKLQTAGQEWIKQNEKPIK